MALHFYWFTEFKLEAKVSNILALEAGSAGLRYTATICLQKLKNRTKHDMLCKYMNYRTHICLAHVLLKHPWGRCQGRIFPLDWMSLDRAILCQTSHAAAMQNAGRQLFLHQLLSNSTAQGNKTGQGLSSKKHLENLSVTVSLNFMQESRENAGRGREAFLPPKDRAVHHTAGTVMELLKSKAHALYKQKSVYPEEDQSGSEDITVSCARKPQQYAIPLF